MSRNPLKLDEEELQILRDFERGEFESIEHFRAEKRRLEAAARKTLHKDKRINIRLSLPRPGETAKTCGSGRDSLSDLDCQHFAQICDWEAQGARLTLRSTASPPACGSGESERAHLGGSR